MLYALNYRDDGSRDPTAAASPRNYYAFPGLRAGVDDDRSEVTLDLPNALA